MGSFGIGGKGSRGQTSFDPTDAFTSRALEELFYRPIKTHIYRYQNKYLIFEDRGCRLWKYDLSFVDPEDIRIIPPENSKNADLLQDPVTGNLYLSYTVNSTGYIAGIDPSTGSILFTQKLENYQWVRGVKVYNNRIWFTHPNKSGQTLMNLYSTAIRGR